LVLVARQEIPVATATTLFSLALVLQLLQQRLVDEAVQVIQMEMLELDKTVGLVVVAVNIKMLRLMALTAQAHLGRVTMVA
tara:strand:- start:257 stop:499 length:243 start_codon:yes stop_codon:yes gene_type:complete